MVTEMKEKAILKAILNTAPDAIIRMDRQGVVLDFLGAAHQMFQFTAEEMVGQSVGRLMPDIHAGRHAQYVDAFFESGDRKVPDFGRQLQAKRRDGTQFPVEIALSQIGEDNDAQIVGIIRDISRRVADQARISDMRTSLELASRKSAVAELSTQVAHELNQPLTAIANYMDALELKLARLQVIEVTDLTRLASRAAEQARLAGDIVQRLRQALAPNDTDARPGDFHEAVARAMTALIASLGAEDIDIAVEHLGEGREVSFDQVQLHQVLANLVWNAVTAIEQASVKRLVITSEVRDNEVELRVTDTGPGVPDAHKVSIFDSFVSDSLNGLGLGLAIAKRIAKAHSGKIWVEDGPEGGSVFRMVLPLK